MKDQEGRDGVRGVVVPILTPLMGIVEHDTASAPVLSLDEADKARSPPLPEEVGLRIDPAHGCR